MAKDHVYIGQTPYDEECAQVGQDGYVLAAKAECEALADCLRQIVGPEPSGALLQIKSFRHDFGSYYGLVCWYDDQIPESVDYAFKCEGNVPARWLPGTKPALSGLSRLYKC